MNMSSFISTLLNNSKYGYVKLIIQFNINDEFALNGFKFKINSLLFLPIDGTLTGNKRVIHIPESFRTGASSSDATYSIAPTNWGNRWVGLGLVD